MTATPLDRQLDEFSARLDALAARATRTVAELRQTCQSALDDLAECKQHVDFAPVDVELARMAARDELLELEGRYEAGIARVLRRIENARDDRSRRCSASRTASTRRRVTSRVGRASCTACRADARASNGPVAHLGTLDPSARPGRALEW